MRIGPILTAADRGNMVADLPSTPARVVLVRHAQSAVPIAGGPDDYQRPLVEDGLRQAELLVDVLSHPRPVAIVSSPYLRAIQTIQPLALAIDAPVRTKHDLREWDSGLAPTPHWERHYARSWADPAYARDGGESLNALTTRATAAVSALARRYPTGTVLIASHGTFIARALIGFGVGGVDWQFSRAMPMPAVYQLEIHTGTLLRAQGPGL